MTDHLGVNDIPNAKSLENNDRSMALAVNAAGTSPHICAETVPARPLTDAEREKLRALAHTSRCPHRGQRLLTQLRADASAPNNRDTLRAIAATAREIVAMKGA